MPGFMNRGGGFQRPMRRPDEFGGSQGPMGPGPFGMQGGQRFGQEFGMQGGGGFGQEYGMPPMDYQMPPMNSGFTRPGQFQVQEPMDGNMMRNPEEIPIRKGMMRRPLRQMGRNQGREPVF